MRELAEIQPGIRVAPNDKESGLLAPSGPMLVSERGTITKVRTFFGNLT